MNFIQFIGAVELGLIYSLVALGVYLSFRTLQFPDLTADGSFPLGAAVAGACILMGFNPFVATLMAVFAGALAGYITAFMATRLRMLNLLTGILTMTALYSVNLRIMGRPNLALLGEKTITSFVHPFLHKLSFLLCTSMMMFFNIMINFSNIIIEKINHFFNQSFDKISLFSITTFPDLSNLLFLIFLTILIMMVLELFLKTRLGFAIRATGSNPGMSRSIGINDQTMIQVGLSLSNALIALAGALFAQVYGFADVSMGVGTIIIGLAAVIIGEAIFHTRNIMMILVSCIVGAIVYRLSVAFALNTTDLGLQASDLNLVTAVLVAVAMMIPTFKRQLKFPQKQKTLKTGKLVLEKDILEHNNSEGTESKKSLNHEGDKI